MFIFCSLRVSTIQNCCHKRFYFAWKVEAICTIICPKGVEKHLKIPLTYVSVSSCKWFSRWSDFWGKGHFSEMFDVLCEKWSYACLVFWKRFFTIFRKKYCSSNFEFCFDNFLYSCQRWPLPFLPFIQLFPGIEVI